jgi:hypothetical protein
VFTRTLQWTLSGTRSIQSVSTHPIFLRSILTLFTHLRRGLPSGLFHSNFSINILHAFIFSSIHATSAAHLFFLDLDHSNYVWWEIQDMKLLIMQFSPQLYLYIYIYIERERESSTLRSCVQPHATSYFLSLRKPSIWQETPHLLPFHLYTIIHRHSHDGLGAGLIANWPETGCVILILILSSVPFSSH